MKIKKEIETKTTLGGSTFRFVKNADDVKFIDRPGSYGLRIENRQQLEELIEILTKAREYFEEEK